MDVTMTVDGSLATFTVVGKLTVQTAPELERAIAQAPADVCDFDLDLSGVDYVSSAGLRVFVATDKNATRRGGTLRLLHPTDDVMKVFDMTGISDLLVVEF